MDVLGYADRFSVRAGGRIAFMVSCERGHTRYRAEIVRLNRAFPLDGGAWEPPVVADLGELPGREQPIRAGSYATVPADGLAFPDGVTVHLWLYPTLPARGREQGIVARWSDETGGFQLLLDADGRLVWRTGDGAGVAEVASDVPLHASRWYEVTGIAADGRLDLGWRELPRGWVRGAPAAEAGGPGTAVGGAGLLLLGAAGMEGDHAADHLNGKIDRVALWPRALAGDELLALSGGAANATIPGLLADWDPLMEFTGRRLIDRSAAGRHGTLVNLPARLVTGANWSGTATNYQTRPAEYGAIHFHEDDLEDCRWAVDFTYDVPADLPPGVYAARLAAGETVEHVPFYVRPAAGAEGRILYLAPTNTYLAYGNEKLFRSMDPRTVERMTAHDIELNAMDRYLASRPELGASTYDLHEDGGGVFYSTRLRPVLTMRPDFVTWMTGELRHFSGDLYLVEWLETMGFASDVATDEDLHTEGIDVLAPYAVVVTGGHPEYWTAPMMDALEDYLAGGGRLMYLGGNGFYWATGMHRDAPHVIEVRRGYSGTKAWESAPGEVYLSTSGEPGGLWRYRGRNPNKLTGIGFTAQGWGGSASYARLPESEDPRAAWIFEGVGRDETIGDFGYIMGGAAGDEIDRFDLQFGTPPETLRLATSEGRQSDYYQLVLEDCSFMTSGMGGQEEPRVRSDITLLETERGGAVFSAGSIAWNASLTWNGCDNNVSRITANVLRRFSERA